MSDRVGQLWDVGKNEQEMRVYLVVDPGVRDGHYNRWLHRAFSFNTGEMTDLQELDGMPWEDLSACVRYG